MIIPVAINMVNGIPIHMLTKMIENFAQRGSDKNGSEPLIKPILLRRAFSGPSSLSKFRIINNEMNCGTAMVITKMVRHIFFHFNPLVLINKARIIPKKKLVTVAKTAQIKVHEKIGKKVPAIRPLKTFPKLASPTQSNKDFGGK